MSQHDGIISNDTGANVRSDINNALSAIFTTHSGATEPSTTYSYQLWMDTSSNVLKIRNSANSAWYTLPISPIANNTVDINGGTIDGATINSSTIGGSSAAAGTFTNLTATGTVTLNQSTIDGLTVGQGAGNVSTNTAVGASALNANTTGGSNTAIGQDALGANTTASNNTAVGYQAGYSLTTACCNTLIGQYAGQALTGERNTFVGNGSGFNMTSGTKNVIIGSYDGNAGGLDIRTSSNNIVLSDGDGNVRMYMISNGDIIFKNTTEAAIIAGSTDGKMIDNYDGARMHSSRVSTSAREHIIFYNPNGDVGDISTSGSSTSYNTSSDYRLKENVVPMSGATERLKQLKPSRFNFIVDPDTTVDGFLAHEVSAIVPEAITGEKDAVDDEGNPIYQGIDQSKLVPLLVATIQELEARIAALESN